MTLDEVRKLDPGTVVHWHRPIPGARNSFRTAKTNEEVTILRVTEKRVVVEWAMKEKVVDPENLYRLPGGVVKKKSRIMIEGKGVINL